MCSERQHLIHRYDAWQKLRETAIRNAGDMKVPESVMDTSYPPPPPADDPDVKQDPNTRPVMSTVLMIGMPKGKLEWERAIQFALDCRSILYQFGVQQVEVQIRDGAYQEQATITQMEARIDLPKDFFRRNESSNPALAIVFGTSRHLS